MWIIYIYIFFFFYFIFLSRLSIQELEHRSRSLIIQEEKDFTINCHSSATSHALYWYRQKHSEGLIFLVVLWKFREEKSQWKITANLNEKKAAKFPAYHNLQSSHLGIYSVGETHSDSRSLQAVPKHTAGPQMLPDTGLLRGGWDTCQNEKPKEDVIASFLKRGIKKWEQRNLYFHSEI